MYTFIFSAFMCQNIVKTINKDTNIEIILLIAQVNQAKPPTIRKMMEGF